MLLKDLLKLMWYEEISVCNEDLRCTSLFRGNSNDLVKSDNEILKREISFMGASTEKDIPITVIYLIVD